MGRRGLIGAGAVALGIALGGCGDGDDGGEQEGPVQPTELAIYDWEGSLVTERPFLTESAAREAGGEAAVIVEETDPEGSDRPQFFALRDRPAVTTEGVAGASAETGPTGEPTVNIELTEQGQQRFEALTRFVSEGALQQQAPKSPQIPLAKPVYIAIVVDEELLSLPVINPVEFPEGVSAAQGIQLTGQFTEAEAEELAERLGG